MEKLSPEALDIKRAEFSEWSVSGDSLQRTFAFEDFNEAMAFVNHVADLAEAQQHHPDIMIRYNKVTLTLSTHEAGGLTDLDFQFARATDGYVAAMK
ncbi:MAG TPA: 4a-hydroxytetrahydrobiopterin dehydratase [Phycisphaerales bacterium]|nr:4a-hydroxytetrahydrobiopterin dehydratase [Phycisphaerales bacterium]HRQ74327.1 4a-hydroxytetrahydrobiopterin dehydratase [Phycisphaerales bacterium]